MMPYLSVLEFTVVGRWLCDQDMDRSGLQHFSVVLYLCQTNVDKYMI